MKSILAILAGVFTSIIIIYLIEMISHKIYPVPPGLNQRDPVIMEEWIKLMPISSLILVVVAWFLGAISGSCVASKVDESRATFCSVIVGLFLLFATLVNLGDFPHPLWMWILGIVAVISGTWLGRKYAV
jgi:hypothetical protein